MKFAILYSRKDIAGVNIAEQLRTYFLPHVPIIEMKKDSFYEENIDQELEELKNIDEIIGPHAEIDCAIKDAKRIRDELNRLIKNG